MLVAGVPRTRLQAIWRVPEPLLEEAQDDATIVAIREIERAGIDIVTDGEIRRESYSNRLATALDGVDADNPGVIRDARGNETRVPRVVGRIRRPRPSRCATCSSSAATPTARRRSRCPGPSRWRSRRRTSSTATARR